ADERDLARRAAHVDLARDVGRREGGTHGPVRRQGDEVVLPGGDDPAERLGGAGPSATGRGRVLESPAREVEGDGARVEELDEVVLVGGAAVASATVDLADDDVVDGRRRLLDGEADGGRARAGFGITHGGGQRLGSEGRAGRDGGVEGERGAAVFAGEVLRGRAADRREVGAHG